MKPATLKQIKDQLKKLPETELTELILRLSKYKKDNKELLTYLLFEADDEENYILSIKEELDLQFVADNRQTYYFIKKGIRKILAGLKKQIRYSQKAETEVVLLMYFLQKMRDFSPSIRRNVMLENTFDRQAALVRKKLLTLHEDLQYDYGTELDEVVAD